MKGAILATSIIPAPIPAADARPSIAFCVRSLSLFAVYVVAARFGLHLAFQHPSATPIWPPSGIALAALLLCDGRLWPAIGAGAFLANLLGDTPVLPSLGIAAGNTLEAVLGAYLARRYAGGRDAFDRPFTIFRWFVLVGLLSTTVSATTGSLSLLAAGRLGAPQFGSVWLTWWLGDAGSALLVAPFLLLWGRDLRLSWNPRKALEIAILTVIVLALAEIDFGVPIPWRGSDYPLGHAFLPVLAWSAFRLDARATITFALGVAALALWGTLRGQGPYAGSDPNLSLLLLQGFISVTTITAVALAAAVRERREAQRVAAELNDALERRVTARTEEVGKGQIMLSQAEALAQLGSWDWDVATNRLWWSDELLRIHRIDRSRAAQDYEGFLEKVHPDDRARARAVVDQALRDARPFDLVYRIRRSDGSVRTLHSRGEVVSDGKGQPVRMFGIARDVTEEREYHERERREAELEALKEQLARQVSDFQILHTLSTRLSASLDLDEVLNEVLSAAVDLQDARMGFIELVAPDRRSLAVAASFGHRKDVERRLGIIPIAEGQGACGTAAARRQHVIVEDVETDPIFTPYRDFARWAGFRSVWSWPLLSRRGDLLGVLSTHHGRPRSPSLRERRLIDLYTRYAASAIESAQLYRQAQGEVEVRMAQEAEVRRLNDDLERRVGERTAALEEMVRELDTFAYTVAHDLRTPIRAMQGLSNILIEDHTQKLGPDGRDLAVRISRAGERMDALIRDLLAYSRLSREDVALGPVDLDHLVREILKDAEAEIAARSADVRAEGPLPEVLAHEMTLRQAVTNLISNALKFSAPGAAPRVRIRAERRGPRVRLWVSDNGIGIAPEDQSRIFRVFERVHAGDRYPGTGIGLAIVRRAMERMNGNAGLESEAGQGSRFWIELRGSGLESGRDEGELYERERSGTADPARGGRSQ